MHEVAMKNLPALYEVSPQQSALDRVKVQEL